MPTAATGRILAGRYRLISQLGAGGMGITYRAWDDVNAVPVVVKMPKREAQSDEEALSRFAREIDAMLSLPHDHIVPITDHGEENGCPYVVMRFLPGGSLADHRRRDDDGNPLANPVGMLHFWLPAVAEALDFIHEKGVLHRDIKPGNIFFDGFWNAFLGDFGIAKVVDASAGLTKEQTLTATMIAIGTPEYMAPELFSPKGKPDGRADQYALAVTVYEMLCGVKPFTGAKAHIVVEHSGMPVPPLQNKGLGIPMPLCVAVERALAKTPPERFTTCAEFARAALRGVPPLPSEPDTARLMCPSCAKILRMPTSADGQWGKCPKCKVAMRVAPGLSALWLRNEEFGSSDADGEEAAEGDFKESSEKPAGLFSTVPPVASWVSRKARELSQELMAIPPWASLALFIVSAAMFLADRGARFTDAAKVIRVPLQAMSSAAKSERAWQERAAAADAEIESLRKQNETLQDNVETLEAEVSQLKNANGAKETQQQPAKISLKTVVNSAGIALVEIPAGKFQMGEGDRAVPVALTSSFWLGKTEVTRGQWEQVMGTKPWTGAGDNSDVDLPAVNVNWNDAVEFCEQLTAVERSSGDLQANEAYRLPTEAEWEYACRAGTTTAYSFGDNEKLLGDFGWFPGNASNAHPVGTKKPNSWGLHDMHGNVWEWCSDWYDGKPAGGIDPLGPAEGLNRVSRGGSWRKDPGLCRSADRGQSVRAKRDRNLGFRVARGRPLQPVASNAATEAPKDSKQTSSPEIMQPKLPLKSIENSVGITLLEIPAGKFQMGESEIAVAVTLTRPFWMGKTEVTRGQWQQVMGTKPWSRSGVKSENDLPATYVRWVDATEFCQKLTDSERNSGTLPANEVYRLPTEAEWEYACRAGSRTAFSFGDDASYLGDWGWFKGNSENKLHSTAMKKPNPWGLHDMHGNVCEWCSNVYEIPASGGTDPLGPAVGSSRVARGGGWAYHPEACRSACRWTNNESGHSSEYLGFRVARGMPVQPAALTAATEAPKNRKTPAPEIMQPHLPLRSVVNSVGITMLELPAGKFLMGERASSVEVILPGSLWMGKTEVTRGQWERVMGTRPWGGLGSKADDDLPTTDVNWTDVTEFCRKLTDQERSRSQLQDNEVYRLPTEVEWEYACRAGTATAYAFGEDESRLGDFAWFDGNANTKPHPVGKKKPNAWGLYDMSGNVLEWCSGRRGMGACVGRGGSCLLNSDYCKSACRLSLADSVRGGAVGFRVARFTSWQKTAAEPAENAARGSETNKPKLPLKKAVNTIGTEMLEIPAGTFQMGEGANSVAVTLPRPFWMGKTEVTQGQWKHVMGTSPWTQTNVTVADLHPAVNVKWEDVITFCETLTKHERQQRKLLPDTAYRLPTEAEWEYACRAGTTTQFSFGDDALRLGDFACFQNSSWSALVGTNSAGIVGARKPNPWGLHDMHGNVWEWCSDWYSEKLVGGVDPTGPVGRAERVYRGGGWWDPPMNCRSAYRNRRNPKDGYDYLGFRLACGPTTPDSDQTVAGTPPTQATAASQKSTVTLPLESAVNGIGMEMLEIPATEYVMGEVPNSVIVKLTQPFWIGKTEVTQGQWKELMGTEPWKGKGDGPTGTNYPATHTSWSDAVKFCDKLTQLAHDQGRLRAVVYRLPTEAEWECACRAGTVTAYSFGDNNAELAEHAWFMVNAADGSHEVGAKPPNPWGLHDMHGNVREWCADWFGNDLKGGADPAGTAEGTLRVIRGGGWGLGTSQCRSSYRSANGTPATRAGNLGFRVACGSPVVTATRQQAAAAPPITWYLADLSPVDSTVGAYQLEKGALATWRVNDRDVKKGFLACAPSFIDFRVPSPKPSILRGAVGISRVNVNSRVRFAIFGNGKKLWESGVITQKPGDGTSIVEEFAVDLTRVSLLRLAVDPMGEINSDHSVWIDPVVELKTAPTTGSPKE